MCSGVAMPTVSAREMVRMLSDSSNPTASSSSSMFHKCLPLVALEEVWRNRIREAQRADGFGLDGALRSLFIHRDADDLDVVGWIEFFEDLFRIRHLRDCLRRHERDGINMLETD